ncbi:MAG: alanine racemase [Chlamydiales bacterium]|nr:alanine racemase [Chlamydiales bacterium]
MKQQKYPHPSWIEIDLTQFRKNVMVMRRHIGEALFCLPVKANAYGHGLCEMGRAAEEAGLDYLGVAHLQEGVDLRRAGVKLPILVLGAIHEDQILDLIEFNLEFTISSKFKADLVAEKCKAKGLKCKVHLEVDTGMQRTGVRTGTAIDLFEHLKKLECFELVGIYSHIATAEKPQDPFALKQIEAFTTLLRHPVFQGVPLIRHLANSGATANYPASHLDMVRPSLITFGYLPEDAAENLKEILPCLSLKSKVSYFKVVEAGEGVSYGRSYITPKRTRIVTIPIGYGDGYRRCLSNRGSVLIRGERFPIVGTICMDQLMVDVGDKEVRVGDEVVLIGKQKSQEISLMEISRLCDTIPYEILCLFNDRIPRIYLQTGLSGVCTNTARLPGSIGPGLLL